MAYVLPTFVVVVDIFRHGNPPPGIPDVSVLGNLSPGRRVMLPQVTPIGFAGAPLYMEVLLPIGTDIRGWNSAGGTDWAEIPSGSGRIYEVLFVDDVGKGFANEHRFAILAQQSPWPDPIP